MSMNNMWKNIGLICCSLMLFMACKNYDSEFTEVTMDDNTIFNGSILDFLEQGDPSRRLTFDSMLLVIDGIPGLRDSLRSEEHTSELQSRENLVCRLLLEKKKT